MRYRQGSSTACMRGAGCSMCCRCRASSTMSRFSSTWCAYATCCSWQPPHFGTYGQGGVTRCGDASMTRTTSAKDVDPLLYRTEISTSSPGCRPRRASSHPCRHGQGTVHHGPCVRDAPGLLLREPVAQQPVHQRHVGLATGRVLDRTHQLPERLLLAGAEVRRGGGVGGDGGVDERTELGRVADLGRGRDPAPAPRDCHRST